MAQTSNQGNTGSKSKSSKTAAAAHSSFGMNMPLMSSAFDTAMWLDAA